MAAPSGTAVETARGTSRRVPSPPAGGFVESLPAEDQVLLTHVLAEEAEYVEDRRLDESGADFALFGVETKFTSKTGSRFGTPTCILAGRRRTSSRVPTLSTEEEQKLFLRFNYARREIQRILHQAGPRLTTSQARTLLAWGHRALTARSDIVRFNLPLVLAMAKRTRLNGIDYNELISEGNVALLRSVEKFDCSRGFKFSTYACRAILKSFSRVAMRASRYRVHFPVEFDPTLEKSDFLERQRVDQELDCVDELKRILTGNTAALNDVEQTVIRERFAIVVAPAAEPPHPKTLEEVGQLIGVTKERVRQIQNRALEKIRVALEHQYLVA